jgi:hypothetical protein
MVDRVSSEIRATAAVVEVHAPSGGFDWGDAGAAGMLALFSIAGGAALLIAGRRRRGGSPGRPGERGPRVDQGRSTSRGAAPTAPPLAFFRVPQTGDTVAADP